MRNEIFLHTHLTAATVLNEQMLKNNKQAI